MFEPTFLFTQKKPMKHKPCLDAHVNVLNKIASRKSISYKKIYAKGLIPSHWKKHFATISIIADYQKILKSLTLLSEYFRKRQQSAVHTSQNKNWLVSTISWNLEKIKREFFLQTNPTLCPHYCPLIRDLSQWQGLISPLYSGLPPLNLTLVNRTTFVPYWSTPPACS